MPRDERPGEVTGQEAGRKQADTAVGKTHPEEHAEIGLKGGRRDAEHVDEGDREIISKTTVMDEPDQARDPEQPQGS